MIALAAALVLQTAAGSAEALKPGLGSSAETNIRFAFRNVCLPWLRTGAKVPVGWGVSTWGSGPVKRFKAMGVRAHVVGVKGDVNVGVHTTATGGRACEIDVNEGRPSEIRGILLDEAARSSEGFSPAKAAYTANGFASRDLLCERGPVGRLGVLMSTVDDASREQPKVLVTMMDGGPPSWRCDQASEPMNYPTPAAPPAR